MIPGILSVPHREGGPATWTNALPVLAVLLLLVLGSGGAFATPLGTAPPGIPGATGPSLHLPSSAGAPPGRVDLAPRTVAVSPSVGASLQWINVTGGNATLAPPAGREGSMAYDPVDHETIYFGGCTAAECADNLTWAFANGAWTNLTNPFDAPPARAGASMDFDANLGGLLLFGGFQPATGAYFRDTWLFQSGTWTNVTGVGTVAPPARAYASMAFDPAYEENGSVLFGGYLPGTGYVNDTWVWQSWSGWTLLNSSVAPPPSGAAQMAYDAAEGVVVLFGCGYGCFVANQTWELYSGQWWQVVPTGAIPPYRYEAAMTYDAGLSAIVLFGGFGFSGYLDDTWTFAHGSWTLLAAGPAPPGRWFSGMSPDSGALAPVLFGGYGALGSLNDTWVLEVPPVAPLVASPSTAETTASLSFSATVSGGTAPFRAVFTFGDGATGLDASRLSPLQTTHAYVKPGTYAASVVVTDAVGATCTSVVTPGVDVTAGPQLAPFGRPFAGDVGLPLPFVAPNVTNGTAPFTYEWRFGDGNNSSGSSTSHAYAKTGTYSGSLTVTDASGGRASADFTASLHPWPNVTIERAPSGGVVGVPMTFYGNASGGTAPYHFAWMFGDGATAVLPFPVHNFSSTGSYTVQVWVNDSSGGSVHQSLSVSVGPAPPSTASTASASGIPSWFWPALGVLLVAGAVGAFALLRRGRSGARP